MQTIRGAVLTLLLLALAPLTAAAQPPVTAGAQLYFDHDGLNVTAWEFRIDAGAWVPFTPVKGAQIGTTTPAVYGWSLPFPAATPGPHALRLRACNVAGCAESDPFAFSMVLIPSKPINLRIGATQ